MTRNDAAYLAGETSRELYTYFNSPASTTTAYAVLITILLFYLARWLGTFNLIPQNLWRMLVAATPNRMIGAFDNDFASQLARSKDVQNQGSTTASRNSLQEEKSLALKRVLHLESGALAQAVQRTTNNSSLGTFMLRTPAPKVPGLGNWDNSCYQNSVLQALASLASLPPFLDDHDGENAQTTKAALKGLILQLNEGQSAASMLWTPAKLKNMSSWQQQDAQEYFSKVLDEIDKETSKAFRLSGTSVGLHIPGDVVSSAGESPKEGSDVKAVAHMGQLPEEFSSSTFQNPMEGFLAQRVGCQSCGYVEGLTLVPFTCLTLPLGNDWVYDIRDCMNDFTALEAIPGVECTKCTLLQARKQLEGVLQASIQSDNSQEEVSTQTQAFHGLVQERLAKIQKALDDGEFPESVLQKCQIRNEHRLSSTKTRQAIVARAPRSLVLHINRSVFNELTGVQSKNYAKVQFPLTLSLGAWCLGNQTQGSEKEAVMEEQWLMQPSLSMLSSTRAMEEHAGGPVYRLRAAITHFGRHENGHYICYRQSPDFWKALPGQTAQPSDETKWWRLSDHQVTQVTEEELLAQGGIFMLFYEQVQSTSQPRSTPGDSPAEETLRPNTEASAAVKKPGSERRDASVMDQHLLPGQTGIETASAAEATVLESTPTAAASTSSHLVGTPNEGSSPRMDELVEPPATSSQAMDLSSKLEPPPQKPVDQGESLLPTPPATPEPGREHSLPNLSPRSGRDRADSPAQAMESMTGYVQAS